MSQRIKEDPGLRSILVNPSTGEVWRKGDKYKNIALGQTLTRIADGNGEEFYKGKTAKLLLDDLAGTNAIITRKDLADYTVQWEEAVSMKLPGSNYTLVTTPPPGSGAVVASILGVMGRYKPTWRNNEISRCFCIYYMALLLLNMTNSIALSLSLIPVQR